MAQAPHDEKEQRAKDAPVQVLELSDTLPPMELKQHESGMWMYHRAAWAGGPEVIWNGAGLNVTDRKTAEHIVNIIHPGSFPEDPEDAQDLPLAHQARANAERDERGPAPAAHKAPEKK